MKEFLFGAAGIILIAVIYVANVELFYDPLDALDAKRLFKQSSDLEKICSIDFLGFNTRGEFFELYKYNVNKAQMDSLHPIILSWENKELSKSAIVQKWKACPLDTASNRLYEFVFAANDLDEWECSSSFKKSLRDSKNHYCFIYINELEQYFLLYSIKEEALYYLRKKGF